MGYMFKLDDEDTVDYRTETGEAYIWNTIKKVWGKVTDWEVLDEIRRNLVGKGMSICTECGGLYGMGKHVHVGEIEPPKKPRKTRKELKAEIRELAGRVSELEVQLDAKELRITSARQRELEEHLHREITDGYKYRRVIREAGTPDMSNATPSARQLFKLYFGKSIYDMEVELTPEEMSKVFEKKEGN